MLSRLRSVLRSGVFVWALLCVCFFWKLTLTTQYLAFDDFDMSRQVIPWVNYAASQVQKSVFPMWEAHQYRGQPLIGQGQAGIVNPLSYLLFLAPRRHGQVQMSILHWYFVLLHFLAGWFAYLLCRDRRLSQTASLGAAVVYGFSGLFGQLNWPQMLSGAVWGPLVLMYGLRIWEDEAWPWWQATMAGTVLGLSWLSGHHQIPIFLTLLLTAILLGTWWRRGDWRFGGVVATALGMMFLVSAAQTLPAWQYGHEAVRWAGAREPLGWNDIVPFNVHQRYAVAPLNLFNVVLTGFTGDGISIFVGAVALALGIVAAMLMWKQHLTVRAGAAVAMAGLAYTLSGVQLLEGPLYALIPMVEKARTPSMATCIWTLGLSLLVAAAIDGLDNGLSAERFTKGSRYAVIGAALLLFPLYLRLSAGQGVPEGRWVLTAVFLLILAAVWSGWRNGTLTPSAAGGLIVLLLLCDQYGGTAYTFKHKEDPPAGFLKQIEDEKDIVQYLRDRKGVFRVMVNREKLGYNLGDQFGIDQADGYLASVTRSALDMEIGSDRVERLMNIRYYLGTEPWRFMTQEVFTSRDGMKIYEDPNPYPRVFAVSRVERVADAAAMARWMSNVEHDLRTTAVTTQDVPELAPCESAPAGSFYRPNGNAMQADVELSCRQMVLISETYDADWKATVDGQATPVYLLDQGVRGVIVPAGKHRIEMRYRPAMVFLGGALTLLSLCSLPFLRRRLNKLPTA